MGPLDTFQAAAYLNAVGMIGYNRLGQTCLPVCSENSYELDTRAEDAPLVRFLRQVKILASHDEVEWIMLVQDVPERYVVCCVSDWEGSESRRSTSETFEQLGSLLQRRGRAKRYRTCGSWRVIVCTGLRQGQPEAQAGSAHGQHGEFRHAQAHWIRTGTTSRRAMALATGCCVGGAIQNVITVQNVSDLTTKCHLEKRLES